MKQRWGAIALIAVLSFFSGGWLLQRGVGQSGTIYDQAGLFDDVLQHVRHYYVDSIPEAALYRKATKGLLEELDDPYSVLLTGEDYESLMEQTEGNYGGLGIRIDVRDGWITVVAPLPDTPAEREGIQPGDQIIAVNGMSTQGWTTDQAVDRLRGEPGSEIELLVRRPAVDEPIPFDITRSQIHIRSVPAGTMFGGGIGYISLNPVSETSAEELASEIARMKDEGMQAMILDLRTNPGGLLDQGVQVADIFLDRDAEIVSTRGRARGSTREFVDQADQRYPDLPVVVLVNRWTASAAEIIAGALQDHDRAVVVGTPTFGKGLVQTLFPLGGEVALKLTTARWYTPSGRTIQREREPAEDTTLVAAMMVETDDAAVEAAEVSDSAMAERPVFHTDAGRVVRGGGGIVPDLLVRRDTLTEGEQEFFEQLGNKLPLYRDVLTSYALDLKSRNAITSERFTVTPAMLEEVYRRLREKDVGLEREVIAEASGLVSDHLAYEIARYVFGRQAEFRRRAANDTQLQTALDLLRQAESPRALLSLAMSIAETRQAADSTD